jgi:hypothetical protein
MGEPEQAGAAASPGTASPGERAGVILPPDQRVRVFISSTLGVRGARRRAGRSPAASDPVWYERAADRAVMPGRM